MRKLALAALTLLAAGCGPEGARRSAVPEGTPVVLVSIDTLRADRLPAYGYRGVATPAIDELRRDSILFERAYSHVPLTLPSHTSLLTGLRPPEHGVRDNVGYTIDAEKTPFLPAVLKRAGYATGAAVSSFVLRGGTGMSAGFDFYEDSIEFRNRSGLGGLQRPGAETLEMALPWLRSVAEGPFFFFLHLYEPHTPYQAPEPFASRYDDAYDAEIAAADKVVGDLVAELRRLGVYDRALIVLLSDHGEGLGEHGEPEHGVLLYTSTLQVPLLVKLPQAQLGGSGEPLPVQLADVFPTLRDLLGLEVERELPGENLLELDGDAPEPRQIYSETFYPRIHFGWSDLASLIAGRHQYVDGPDPELYDLVADPSQEHNVLRQERRISAGLRDSLAGYDRTLTSPAEADEETRQALLALGYVGTAASTDRGPLADPKTQLHTLVDLKAGFSHFTREEYEEAVPAFRRAIAQNPGMLDAWEYLGRSLQELGRFEEALEAFTEALELSGGASSQLALTAAALFLQLDRFVEAGAHARLALEANPPLAHGLLAQVALGLGELDEAEDHARRAMEAKQTRLGPMITLAEVLHARGAYEDALELTRRAEEEFAARKHQDTSLIRGLYLLRGKVHADLGQAEPAERAFRREIELHPDALQAYSNLALFYALTRRPQLVGSTLRALVEANPSALAYAEAVKTLRILGDERSAHGLLRRAHDLFPAAEALRQL